MRNTLWFVWIGGILTNLSDIGLEETVVCSCILEKKDWLANKAETLAIAILDKKERDTKLWR